MPGTVTRPGAAHVSARQTFTEPDEIACATRVATAQLNARARPCLAIQALLAAYAGRKAIVDESSVRTAAAEITAD